MDFYSLSPNELSFADLFPVFKSFRKYQIHILEFLKDSSADNRDEFTYGGSLNQPVML